MSGKSAPAQMTESPEPPVTASIWFRWRFPAVFAAALLLAVGHPLSPDLLTDQGVFDGLCSLLILAVMLLVFEERRQRWMALPVAVVSLLLLWTSHATPAPAARWLLVASHLLAALFFGFALYGIVTTLLAPRIPHRPFLGAACGYLLLGIIWTLLYTAVETAAPGSFHAPTATGKLPAAAGPDRSLLSYFSFITLATVGYGDVTPVTELARTLAWLEAIVGQFYLGVLVAGLVGFRFTQAFQRGSADETAS